MDECIRKKIDSIDFLPTLPSIVADVIAVIEDPKSSASDVVRHMDPSLVGEVLKVANSAYFGRKSLRRIVTVEQAVATIGYENLSSIVLQMPFLFMLDGKDHVFDRSGFVRHSFTAALLARTVSSAFDLGTPSMVYASGLLHDVGAIVIYQYFTREWNLINDFVHERQLSRLEAERQVLSMDHARVGFLLLEKWGLPEVIVKSVRLHHDRGKIGNDENAYVTWLGNILAKGIDFQNDFIDFNSFFDKQRQLLHTEIPQRYLLKHHVELFEQAYNRLKGTIGFLEKTSGDKDD